MIRIVVLAVALVLAPLSLVAQQVRSLASNNSDGVAVIIANKDYYSGKFPVEYAERDAEAIKEYLVRFLRFDERRIIVRKNATKYHFEQIFRPGGDLAAMVRPGRSNVFVFYAGHAAPVAGSNQTHLLPYEV